MKTGMVLGIIGGVIALLIGGIGYSATSALGSLSSGVGYADGATTMQFYSIMAIILPIAGLVGSGLTSKNVQAGAGLMGVSAAGILWVFGLGFLSIIPAALLGIGAFLVIADADQGPYHQKEE